MKFHVAPPSRVRAQKTRPSLPLVLAREEDGKS